MGWIEDRDEVMESLTAMHMGGQQLTSMDENGFGPSIHEGGM